MIVLFLKPIQYLQERGEGEREPENYPRIRVKYNSSKNIFLYFHHLILYFNNFITFDFIGEEMLFNYTSHT